LKNSNYQPGVPVLKGKVFMKKYLITAIPFALLLCISVLYSATDCISTYTNKHYGYAIKVPAGWDMAEMMLDDSHQFIAAKNKSTSIIVRTIDASRYTMEKVYHDKRWKLWERDPSLVRIIDNNIKSMEHGKVAVFNYKSKSGRILHRILLKKTTRWIFIVECRAPERSFYNLEKRFNTAFSSFSHDASSSNTSSLNNPVDRKTFNSDSGDNSGLLDLEEEK